MKNFFFKNFYTKRGIGNVTSGFTLIELMVSTSIFIIVMVVATGALLSIVDANRRSQSAKVSIDNLTFVLETMSRYIRVGTKYSCISYLNPVIGSFQNYPLNDCPYEGSEGDSLPRTIFSFTYDDISDSEGPYVISYAFFTNQIFQRILKSSNDNTLWEPLTDPDIIIEDMKFYVEGSSPDDDKQPHVMITVKGHAGGENMKYRTDFDLQTSLTQRKED